MLPLIHVAMPHPSSALQEVAVYHRVPHVTLIIQESAVLCVVLLAHQARFVVKTLEFLVLNSSELSRCINIYSLFISTGFQTSMRRILLHSHPLKFGARSFEINIRRSKKQAHFRSSSRDTIFPVK
jgi:hypothetical protein